MRKSIVALLRMFAFGLLMIPFVSCEKDTDGDDIKQEETGGTEDFFVDAIDLGLSVKWAEHNVGATKSEEYGGYYAWGEIEEKDVYANVNYKYYDNNKEDFVSIGANISATEYDIAYVSWGKDWRMPTQKEIEELCDGCSWLWTSVNGVNGYRVTGPNGNNIFLPAGGFRVDSDIEGRGSEGRYWTGTLIENGYSYYLYFDDEIQECDYSHRSYGRTIRPVKDK